jgi:hypothetical protein
VVLGEVDEPPLEPPLVPPLPLPPMFGHGWPLWPRRGAVCGVVEPPVDGWVVVGAELAEGSGLAASTIAVPPVTSSAAAMPAVRIARRKP